MDIKYFKELYKNISIEEIINRINYFNNYISPKNVSEEVLKKEIAKIFEVNNGNKKFSIFNDSHIFSNPSESYYFYRVRKFSPEDKNLNNFLNKSFHSMNNKQDLLWAPEKYCKWGRLNRPQNSVLYVSTQATNAIYETQLKLGEFFFLILYENVKQMRLAQIHNPVYLYEFDELENAKRLLFHNFLIDQFTKYVPVGREYLYKTSNLIYENYFMSEDIDAFTYPSIATEEKIGMIFCFTKDKTIENLRIIGVMVCKLFSSDSNSLFNVYSYYDGILEGDKIMFYDYNSTISREKLGDFTLVRDMGL